VNESPAEPSNPAIPETGVVKLHWLRIDRFRNVRPGTELRFDDHRNLVLGKNGSGKSTLLRLLAVVISSRFQLLHEPYDLSYRLQLGDLLIEARAWTSESALPPGLPPDLAASQSGLSPRLEARYEARITHGLGGEVYLIDLVEGMGTARRLSPERKDWPPVDGKRYTLNPTLSQALIVLIFTREHPETFSGRNWRRSQTIGHTLRRFDESLDTFRQIIGGGEDDELLGTPVVSAMRVDRAPTSWLPLTVIPVASSDFESIDEAFPREVPLDLTPGMRAVLRPFARALGLRKAEAHMNFEEKSSITEGSESWSYRTMQFLFTRQDGSIINHNQLSYGQKRLLSFLYYLATNDQVVIADELVNGLHHEWIEMCLDLLGERQAFLTSQNPLLIDYLPPGSAEQAQARYLLCRSEQTERGEQLCWENMPAEDADRFFRAYEVGVRQAGEVLRSKGLW
jgi:energy-coupling factor transporter ATP-binding protein EcfA2